MWWTRGGHNSANACFPLALPRLLVPCLSCRKRPQHGISAATFMLPLNSGFLWTTDIDSTKSSMFWGANPIFHWKASKNRDRAAEAINLKSSWHHAASLLEEVVKVTLLKHWFGMGSSSWSFWDLSFPFPPGEMFQNIISGNKSNQNFVCVLLNSPFLGVLPPHFFRLSGHSNTNSHYVVLSIESN